VGRRDPGQVGRAVVQRVGVVVRDDPVGLRRRAVERVRDQARNLEGLPAHHRDREAAPHVPRDQHDLARGGAHAQDAGGGDLQDVRLETPLLLLGERRVLPAARPVGRGTPG